MASVQPELAAQLRFQASLIRLCSAPSMSQSVKPESRTPADAIEDLAVLVPVRLAPKSAGRRTSHDQFLDWQPRSNLL